MTTQGNAWAWYDIDPSLDLPAAISAINARMKRLESAPSIQERTFSPQFRVNTTDATATIIETLAMPVDTTTLVVGYVVARRTGGAAGAAQDGAGYRVEFVAKNAAGTSALIGAATITALGESQAAWDVTATASGGSVLLKVVGAANNSVSWRWSRRTFPVST